MRTKYILRFLIALLVSASAFGQQSLTNPVDLYEEDLTRNGKKRLFNDKMLNILFANKVGTAFGGTNDLSLQKFYTAIDAGDTSLSLGANFDSRCGDETKQLIWVFSGGLKIKSKDKFATVYKDGDFQEDNIGTTLKISYIGNGIINFSKLERFDKAANTKKTIKNREEAVIKNREILCEKYKQKTAKFNSEELGKIQETYTKLSAFDSEMTDVAKTIQNKQDELYTELAKEEIDYLEKNKMYRYLWNYWLSLEVFTPFGENKYKTTPNVLTTALKERSFYAFTASFSGNTMWQFSSGESVFIKVRANVKNNNNILVDNLTNTPFQTTTIGADNITVVTNSDEGYITDFKQFLTPSLSIEPAFFTLNNTIGFSPSVEFNNGKYNKTNWKLGIPISLKDKDGKPKVNFEVQWKEVNTFTTSIHYIGISANYLFGELIN
ncbi:hypothetical protein [Flavobacterium sp.]|mgnify:CR=1 FL=1|uniref:hypothetical protein n=1 Tax=Flavobacterium sp. TaxID=239 RepID=UPI002FDC8CC0